jgi:GT2 family glycosyltransferase
VTATPQPELSFRRLRALADVLRLSGQTPTPLRPFVVELFRAQTDFNHRVIDVLEDAGWTFGRADHPAAVEQRLGALAAAIPRIANVRGGVRGQLILWTKRAGVAGLEVALGPAIGAMAQLNRGLVEALKSRRPLPGGADLRRHFASGRRLGLDGWLEAQAQFYEAVAQLVASLGGALTDPAEAFAQFGAINEARVKAAWPRTPGRSVVQVVAGTDAIDPRCDVVLRLPAGEALAADAVDTVAELFAARPEVQLCYGDTFFDEAGIAALKPGWSPEYLLGCSYIGGCFAVRRALAVRLGLDATTPLRWLLEAQPDESQVARIPWVLSRRRIAEEADLAHERALVAAQLGPGATVEQNGLHRRVRLHPPGAPLVTIIVPFKDKVELLRGLWASLTRFDPGLPFELLLVSNQSEQLATFEFLAQLRDPRVSWFAWDQPFNWSAINNAAATRARGELLLFLNNDTEITHDGWLRDLAGYAAHPQIGVAGARLLYPDRSVQHAGVVIGLRELAGHVFARWRPEYGPTPFGSPELTRNWSAVTGACLMIRRALFEEVHGFDEGIRISGGDIELCLRIRARGLRVVCVGHVALLHFESVSRRSDPVPPEDIRKERIAYAALLDAGDPYYHPQLSTEAGHGGLKVTPARG